MAEKQVFLTGKLAAERLEKTLLETGLEPARFNVIDIGIKVAALMTEAIVRKRLNLPEGVSRVVVPGRARMDLEALGEAFGVPFVRGPDEMIDLPEYLGKGGKPPDLSRHDLRIFAEIVEAPDLTVEGLLKRARAHRAAGADVIDVGCQPGQSFDHLEEAVGALKAEGFRVSVDSGDITELERAIAAGADHVLSLDEDTVSLAAGTDCEPVLVPKPHGDFASLIRAIEKADRLGVRVMADPILDPIHFGFTQSLERYARLRRERPDVEILMGTGNLTELTDVDSQGLTGLLLGVCSELSIRNVLIVQVSPHTRRTVQEHDAARRLMYRAKQDQALPKGYGGGLLSLHELRPFPYRPEEVAEMAAAVRDLNYRIEVTEEGVHVYNKAVHEVREDPYQLFPMLDVDEDGGHAFYLGYELAKAEIAYRLGKRYAQDEPLDWGIAADAADEDLTLQRKQGPTLKLRKAQRLKEGERRRAEVRDAKRSGEENRNKDGGGTPGEPSDPS